MFRVLLPLQESDEVPRTDGHGERGLLGGRRRSARLSARSPSGRLLRAEAQATIPSLKLAPTGVSRTDNNRSHHDSIRPS